MGEADVLNDFSFLFGFLDCRQKVGVRRDEDYPIAEVFVGGYQYVNSNVDIDSLLVKAAAGFEKVAKGVFKTVLLEIGEKFLLVRKKFLCFF